MKKVLLVALNASYSHTNIAVRSVCSYILKERPQYRDSLFFAEYTINQSEMEILKGISSFNADVVIFSTYIWNGTFVSQIIIDLKRVFPSLLTGAAGPEYSYCAEKYLSGTQGLDFVLRGDEKSALEFLEEDFNFNGGRGIFEGKQKICSLDELVFPYSDVELNENKDKKIFYYESSRGCPFSCSYCLSSVEKNVIFRDVSLVYRDLDRFLNAGVSLVKFVDRTYNINPERYIGIWKYIKEHHNGKTMFHFEIEAEYLTDEALDFLKDMPAGIMQFEMGLQSANKKTLKAVSRSQNVELLAQKIKLLPSTIHKHLDLIAGLPEEDITSFGKSYDFVMALKPDALQLGFLKVLPGTAMENYAENNSYSWQKNPVYEILSTPWLSFNDLMYLKDVELLTDVLWNKGTFSFTVNYIFRTVSPWSFIRLFADFARKKNAFEAARKDSYWFELLWNFFDDENNLHDKELNPLVLKNLLKYDFVRSGKKGSFPEWYNHIYSKEEHRKLLQENDMLSNSRIGFAFSEYEEFDCNVLAEFLEKDLKHVCLLIKYKK